MSIPVFVFLFGLATGSFLNALISRMERGISVLKGRSHCVSCLHELAWYDLIPLASFALLKGKCRYCQSPISFQYPLVEAATALLFLAIFYHVQGSELLYGAYLAVVFSLLLVIFVYDLKYFIIPDSVVYSAMGLVILWRLFGLLKFDSFLTDWKLFGIWSAFGGLGFEISLSLLQILFAAAGAGIFFFSIFTLSGGRAMGFGDVKFALFMGLFLGWPNILVGLFMAFLLGAAAGVFLVLSREKHLASEVPFAPFLVLGTFIALFWGEGVVSWYLAFL